MEPLNRHITTHSWYYPILRIKTCILDKMDVSANWSRFTNVRIVSLDPWFTNKNTLLPYKTISAICTGIGIAARAGRRAFFRWLKFGRLKNLGSIAISKFEFWMNSLNNLVRFLASHKIAFFWFTNKNTLLSSVPPLSFLFWSEIPLCKVVVHFSSQEHWSSAGYTRRRLMAPGPNRARKTYQARSDELA